MWVRWPKTKARPKKSVKNNNKNIKQTKTKNKNNKNKKTPNRLGLLLATEHELSLRRVKHVLLLFFSHWLAIRTASGALLSLRDNLKKFYWDIRTAKDCMSTNRTLLYRMYLWWSSCIYTPASESYDKRLESLYLRYAFRALINSLVCWFCTSTIVNRSLAWRFSEGFKKCCFFKSLSFFFNFFSCKNLKQFFRQALNTHTHTHTHTHARTHARAHTHTHTHTHKD